MIKAISLVFVTVLTCGAVVAQNTNSSTTTTERPLLPRLLEAGDDLDPALRRAVDSSSLVTLD